MFEVPRGIGLILGARGGFGEHLGSKQSVSPMRRVAFGLILEGLGVHLGGIGGNFDSFGEPRGSFLEVRGRFVYYFLLKSIQN